MIFLLEASRSCEAAGRRSLTWINEAATPGQGGRVAQREGPVPPVDGHQGRAADGDV
jgi:hypothetical protein